MKTAFTATTLAVVLAAACAPAQAQFSKKQNDPQGAAAGASAKGAAANLEYCDEPMGTIAVVEEQEGDWYRYLTSDLRLPSTIPVIRMLIQQSNCFVVVERGRAISTISASPFATTWQASSGRCSRPTTITGMSTIRRIAAATARLCPSATSEPQTICPTRRS